MEKESYPLEDLYFENLKLNNKKIFYDARIFCNTFMILIKSLPIDSTFNSFFNEIINIINKKQN